MMDAYNLGWKLAHHILGLSPSGGDVLASYNSERVGIARQLIDFDIKFASMFSGSIGASTAELAAELTPDQFLQAFTDFNGFSTGVGYEYGPSCVVQSIDSQGTCNAVTGTDYLSGILRQGRRLLDSVVMRFADGNPRHLQDGINPPRSCFPSSLLPRLSLQWPLPSPRISCRRHIASKRCFSPLHHQTL